MLTLSFSGGRTTISISGIECSAIQRMSLETISGKKLKMLFSQTFQNKLSVFIL
jgi:hypothetical protein